MTHLIVGHGVSWCFGTRMLLSLLFFCWMYSQIVFQWPTFINSFNSAIVSSAAK
jgi:hypothetical protein